MSVKISTDKPISLEDIAKIVTDTGVFCINCNGYKYQTTDIESYDHGGGVPLEGFKSPQWVYFHCPRCDYKANLSKILNEIEGKYREEMR